MQKNCRAKKMASIASTGLTTSSVSTADDAARKAFDDEMSLSRVNVAAAKADKTDRVYRLAVIYLELIESL